MLSPSSCRRTTNSFWCGFQVHFYRHHWGAIYGNHVHHILPTLWIRIRFIRHMEDRGAEETKNEKMFDGWSWLKREELTRAPHVQRVQARGSRGDMDTHFLIFPSCTQSEALRQATACSRLDRLIWGGRECVITQPLTLVSHRSLGSLSQATSIPQFLILRDCILL